MRSSSTFTKYGKYEIGQSRRGYAHCQAVQQCSAHRGLAARLSRTNLFYSADWLVERWVVTSDLLREVSGCFTMHFAERQFMTSDDDC